MSIFFSGGGPEVLRAGPDVDAAGPEVLRAGPDVDPAGPE